MVEFLAYCHCNYEILFLVQSHFCPQHGLLTAVGQVAFFALKRRARDFLPVPRGDDLFKSLLFRLSSAFLLRELLVHDCSTAWTGKQIWISQFHLLSNAKEVQRSNWQEKIGS